MGKKLRHWRGDGLPEILARHIADPLRVDDSRGALLGPDDRCRRKASPCRSVPQPLHWPCVLPPGTHSHPTLPKISLFPRTPTKSEAPSRLDPAAAVPIACGARRTATKQRQNDCPEAHERLIAALLFAACFTSTTRARRAGSVSPRHTSSSRHNTGLYKLWGRKVARRRLEDGTSRTEACATLVLDAELPAACSPP